MFKNVGSKIAKFRSSKIHKYFISTYLSFLIIFSITFLFWITHREGDSFFQIMFELIFFGGLITLLLPISVVFVSFITSIIVFIRYKKENIIQKFTICLTNFVIVVYSFVILFFANSLYVDKVSNGTCQLQTQKHLQELSVTNINFKELDTNKNNILDTIEIDYTISSISNKNLKAYINVDLENINEKPLPLMYDTTPLDIRPTPTIIHPGENKYRGFLDFDSSQANTLNPSEFTIPLTEAKKSTNQTFQIAARNDPRENDNCGVIGADNSKLLIINYNNQTSFNLNKYEILSDPFKSIENYLHI